MFLKSVGYLDRREKIIVFRFLQKLWMQSVVFNIPANFYRDLLYIHVDICKISVNRWKYLINEIVLQPSSLNRSMTNIKSRGTECTEKCSNLLWTMFPNIWKKNQNLQKHGINMNKWQSISFDSLQFRTGIEMFDVAVFVL